MKRPRTQEIDINPSFINECKKEFNSDPINTIARNAVVSIGSMLSTVNSTHLNSINHIFLNSVKKRILNLLIRVDPVVVGYMLD